MNPMNSYLELVLGNIVVIAVYCFLLTRMITQENNNLNL